MKLRGYLFAQIFSFKFFLTKCTYRIELEEIKSVLCNHRMVKNAAVILHSPVPTDPSANQIVAFVERETQRQHGPITDDEVIIQLRSHIANSLPSCIYTNLLHRTMF